MVDLEIIKIGGGILYNRSCFVRAVSNLRNKVLEGKKIIVVISALYGVTDFLVESCKEVFRGNLKSQDMIRELEQIHWDYISSLENEKVKIDSQKKIDAALLMLQEFVGKIELARSNEGKHLDFVNSFGERLSPIVLEAYLLDGGIKVKQFDAEEAGIYCTEGIDCITVDYDKTSKSLHEKITPLLEEHVVLLPGYYGITQQGEVRTFGRGGTDYSAAFIASIYGVRLEIWKDVPGVMSTDPKLVREAQRMPFLSYDEAEELSNAGAKILHPKTMEPMRRNGLEIEIKNFFDLHGHGTIISSKRNISENKIKSITINMPISFMRLQGRSDISAFRDIFVKKMKDTPLRFSLVSSWGNEFSLVVKTHELHMSLEKIKEITNGSQGISIDWSSGMALITLVGEGICEDASVSKLVYDCMRRKNIMVVSPVECFSNIKMNIVLDERDGANAVRAMHQEFFNKGDGT